MAVPQSALPPLPTRRVLGIDFFDGTPAEAVAAISTRGGLVVAPAAPSLIAFQNDPDYRAAILDADLAIADSGWMVVFWKLLRRESLTRISGLALFRALLESPAARGPRNLFWILPNEAAKEKALAFACQWGDPLTSEDCYVAPHYATRASVGQAFLPAETRRPSGAIARQESGFRVSDDTLLGCLEQRKPQHVIIAIGGGTQDKLGSWLKHHLSYRPAIYCIGAAPGFVTGDQVAIPMWADRLYLGWVFRLFAQPRVFFPRLWSARRLPGLIVRYGRELPPLKVKRDL